jgi:hypothetical protein
MDAKGYNEHSVLMCECKPFGPAHAYEPGESCSPTHVMPLEAQKPAAEQQRDGLLEAIRLHKDSVANYQDHGSDRDLYETADAVEKEMKNA